MEPDSDVQLCRITIVAPRTRMDLALPVDATLADLLPTLLKHAGEDPQDPGFLRGGWVLQRLGDKPLDTGRRLSALSVRDGETLHLRHRDSALPELAFDDVADAMAGARRPAWVPADTRRASVVAASVLGLLSIAVLALFGPPWPLPAAILLGITVVCTGAAVALSRSYDAPSAAVAAVVVAATSGLVGGVAVMAGEQGLVRAGAPGLLVGSAVVLLVSVVAVLGVRAGKDGFLAVALGAVVVILAAGATTLEIASAHAVAGITLAVLMAFAAALPALAARIARLPLPPIPTSAADLRRADDLLPGADVLDRALAAERSFTALTATTGLLVSGCLVIAVGQPSWYGRTLAVVVAIAFCLRARHLTGRTQRVWLLATAALDLGLGVWGFAASLDRPVAVVVPLLLLMAAGVSIWWGVRMTDRRLTPYWGRFGDVIEVLVLLSVIPLAIGVTGAYTEMQSLFG